MEKLAIFGGTPVRTTPFTKGKRFGAEELKEVEEALNQNTLFYWFGNKVKQLNSDFAKLYNRNYCVATSSGTAAIHAALGAVGVTEGDEVITSPITDFGTIIGILYQNAIPVFADVDINTCNLDPKSVREKITERTKAIIVVHLAGNPADAEEFQKIGKEYNIKIIEDCAQCYCAYIGDKMAGQFSDISCFSLNDFKHISAGDGGMLLTDDKDLYEKAHKFVDKNYDRFGTSVNRNIDSVAINYRMNELTAAVGIAQIKKLDFICSSRNKNGKRLTEGIKDIKGLYPPYVKPGNKSSYWFYLMRIDEETFGASAKEVADALVAEGVPSQVGYIPECIYEYELFKNLSAYPRTHAPFDSKYYKGTPNYDTGLCPVAEKLLKTTVRVAINEFMTDKDIDDIIYAIKKIAYHYSK